MKVSEVIKELQGFMDRDGDLDVGVCTIYGGFVHWAMDVCEIGSDGEVCIYLYCRVIQCPKCKKIWASTERKDIDTSMICIECGGDRVKIMGLMGFHNEEIK